MAKVSTADMPQISKEQPSIARDGQSIDGRYASNIEDEALVEALNWTNALTTADSRALAAQIPEIDPDDFVAELAQLAVDEPYDGASSPDEDNE